MKWTRNGLGSAGLEGLRPFEDGPASPVPCGQGVCSDFMMEGKPRSRSPVRLSQRLAGARRNDACASPLSKGSAPPPVDRRVLPYVPCGHLDVA